MKPIHTTNSVLVFDLDDTLYAEQDYKISGMKAVCQLIASNYPQYQATDLWRKLDSSSHDWLNTLCQYCGLNTDEQTSLLWHYRLHMPSITPFMPSENFKQLIAPFAGCALLSDGRSFTQRQKLKALGLLDCFEHILISEAHTSEKPEPLRFALLEACYPNRQMIYIGDNITKDFITPNQRGWLSLGLLGNSRNIHQHQTTQFSAQHQPHYWLAQLNDIKDLSC